jgi:hypothetical protein
MRAATAVSWQLLIAAVCAAAQHPAARQRNISVSSSNTVYLLGIVCIRVLFLVLFVMTGCIEVACPAPTTCLLATTSFLAAWLSKPSFSLHHSHFCSHVYSSCPPQQGLCTVLYTALCHTLSHRDHHQTTRLLAACCTVCALQGGAHEAVVGAGMHCLYYILPSSTLTRICTACCTACCTVFALQGGPPPGRGSAGAQGIMLPELHVVLEITCTLIAFVPSVKQPQNRCAFPADRSPPGRGGSTRLHCLCYTLSCILLLTSIRPVVLCLSRRRPLTRPWQQWPSGPRRPSHPAGVTSL